MPKSLFKGLASGFEPVASINDYLLVTSTHPLLIKALLAEGKFPPRENTFLWRTAFSILKGKKLQLIGQRFLKLSVNSEHRFLPVVEVINFF